MSAAPHGIATDSERPSKRFDRLLIVRLSAMGDVLHSLPAVCALRTAFPESMIGWLIEERWVELLCAPGTARRGERSPGRPVVDRAHTVRLKEWRRSLTSRRSTREIANVWNEVRTSGYDIAVDMQGAIRSAVLARSSKASVVYGAEQPWEGPAAWFYNRKVAPQGKHVVEQWHSLAEALVGKRLAVQSVQLPRSAAAEGSVDAKLKAFKIGRFSVISPGAGWGAKEWPAERYGVVARELAKTGLRSIINYGPGEEELANAVVTESGGAGQLMQGSISELIALLRRAQLFVGGDTGPMHLAAALKVPVVALFGPTDPARTGPYATKSVVLRENASVTSHARREKTDPGLLKIVPEEVVQAAGNLLALK